MQFSNSFDTSPTNFDRTIDDFSGGCDPDFDTQEEELEREFAELRLTFGEWGQP